MARRETAELNGLAVRRDIFEKVTWREPLARRDEYGVTNVLWYRSKLEQSSVYADMWEEAASDERPTANLRLFSAQKQRDSLRQTL
jgi:hypothetical protein